jgi:glycosyltransferase involved in cell wall biosynthesis
LPDLQSRLQVIPNGVDLAAFRPWQGSAPQDPPKIVVVGRLSAEKNHAFLLRVLAELDEVPLTLWIVGAGPEERRLKALVERLSLKNRVKFYGYCTDITEILSYSDIHVMPTRSEGFGLVAAEAMAAGLPSVVTDLPVLREVLGEEGFSAFFAPLNDRTVFVAQLRRLLLDPALRRRMGNQALKAARKHDRAQMHKAYTDLYRSLGAY